MNNKNLELLENVWLYNSLSYSFMQISCCQWDEEEEDEEDINKFSYNIEKRIITEFSRLDKISIYYNEAYHKDFIYDWKIVKDKKIIESLNNVHTELENIFNTTKLL
jgi:hypothetical protein